MKRFMKRFAVLSLAAVLLTGCGAAPAEKKEQAETEEYVEIVEPEVPMADPGVKETAPAKQAAAELGEIASAESPAAVSTTLTPVASEVKVKKNSRCRVDYSNVADGYVMVQYSGTTDKRLKAQVKGPTTTYTYDLTAGQWEVFPISDGNGNYKVSLFKNVSGTKYTVELSASFKVELKDEFGPYLYPNQYVNYSAAPNTVAKAAELVKGKEKPLEKVAVIYDYVVKSLSYDYGKASTITSGYLPVLDNVLAEKKGICFDYASLMTGMLRSQGVPCKLVVGYAGGAYHAWINVWSEENGWVDSAIFFDGTTWQRMDPTFASSSKQSASVMAYIGDGSNYSVKYLY